MPIEQIKLGDSVWAYNDTTQQYGLKQVVHLFRYQRDTIYTITVGTKTIEATADHPFFIGGKWLKVQQLKVGDSVVTYSGNKLAITNIQQVAKPTIVYNFEVADFHTYYVGQQKVLVHNSGPCPNKLPQIAKKATKGGLTNPQLVQKSATLAERAIGGTGGVAGTAKHQYANALLNRYQSIYGSRGLSTNVYFNNGVGNRGFLDVLDRTNGIIYDFKFGNAVMSPAQYNKYFNNFGLPIQVIRP